MLYITDIVKLFTQSYNMQRFKYILFNISFMNTPVFRKVS